ncbi:Transcriptional regulator protein PpsR [Rhodovulum sp. PH10]|uniref:transcriptional regulator PpsR n=1 Tax=Rhodovulum sp. PH10 TaxID=1187851 RepID=UPI00027C2193|nr:transcriptional regulator PpsR [Rhodovulum sp. PH10]EJW12802.1 Transcriptional regulator protein PpsR [Rhodovulum sp. PH10]
MTTLNIAQPDVTLLLDTNGVIREVTLSDAIFEKGVEAWLGKPWVETVTGLGEDKVRRMVQDALETGVSAFRQVTQRFPSGRELPIEYTTVLLGGRPGLLAIGKNLQAVAELQSRLIAAQQTMERDYWKLRDVETRYRLLFQSSTEAVLLLRASNLKIVEANPAAVHALGAAGEPPGSVAGRDFLADVLPEERDVLQAMLARVREQGKAPGIIMHFGEDRKACLVRASLMTSDPGPIFLIQLAPVGSPLPLPAQPDRLSVEDLLERMPDGFVVINQDGVIRRANQAFLDLVEVGSKGVVVGERLGRWLWRPGADLTVLLANVHRQRFVRLFSTTIHGELGANTEVEISAAGTGEPGNPHVGVLLRDVARRLPPIEDADRLISALGPLTEQIGKTTLRKLVRDTVGVVERHYVRAALDLAGGNRTAAAELLGLSRQSLYAKLNRYDLGDTPPAGSSGKG